MKRRNLVFPEGGEREKLLLLLWPTYVHVDEIVRQLDEIPEGRPVKKSSVRVIAQRFKLRRPFGPGRWARETAIAGLGDGK